MKTKGKEYNKLKHNVSLCYTLIDAIIKIEAGGLGSPTLTNVLNETNVRLIKDLTKLTEYDELTPSTD